MPCFLFKYKIYFRAFFNSKASTDTSVMDCLKNQSKKYPRLIILMILELFITLLWAWVLKLQFFTTVCKMCNIILMQFIIETDTCINLTFV